MATLAIFNQVTLDDVYARVATLALDVDAFIERTIEEPSGDREADFVTSLSLSHEQLVEAEVGPDWKALCRMLHRESFLAHDKNPRWTGLQDSLRKRPDHRYTRAVRPIGVRTLRAIVPKAPWDYRAMPSETLGFSGTREQLVKALMSQILPTVGGEEYLYLLPPDAETRALIVLATTAAAMLTESAALKSDARRRARVLRADFYEKTIHLMGLGDYFQAVRRVLELEHPEHVPVRVPWPTSDSPVRDIGIIEYRGQRDQYLALNAPTLRKLQ